MNEPIESNCGMRSTSYCSFRWSLGQAARVIHWWNRRIWQWTRKRRRLFGVKRCKSSCDANHWRRPYKPRRWLQRVPRRRWAGQTFGHKGKGKRTFWLTTWPWVVLEKSCIGTQPQRSFARCVWNGLHPALLATMYWLTRAERVSIGNWRYIGLKTWRADHVLRMWSAIVPPSARPCNGNMPFSGSMKCFWYV